MKHTRGPGNETGCCIFIVYSVSEVVCVCHISYSVFFNKLYHTAKYYRVKVSLSSPTGDRLKEDSEDLASAVATAGNEHPYDSD